MWIATREQLRKLSEGKRCKYLDFGEDTRKGNPETHSGSLQMFSKDCGFDKVHPSWQSPATVLVSGIVGALF